MSKTHGFTPAEIATYEKLFKAMDTDGSGKLDHSEVQALMRNVGEEVSFNRVGEIIKMVDVNSDGEVDFQEFLGEPSLREAHRRGSGARVRDPTGAHGEQGREGTVAASFMSGGEPTAAAFSSCRTAVSATKWGKSDGLMELCPLSPVPFEALRSPLQLSSLLVLTPVPRGCTLCRERRARIPGI